MLPSVAVMLVVVFSAQLAAQPSLAWLAPLGRLAWPWYVPVGTGLTILAGVVFAAFPRRELSP